MKKTIFKGIATALITPLTENGIDYDNFGRLIDWQIEEGIDALVVCGTTGEASTLTDDEHRAAIEFAVKRANKRIPIIAGTGSNDTSYALDLTKCANEVGVDGVLVVTPYYNKATQKGLVKMFEQIADHSTSPVILYNVPSRTGVNIEPATYEALADHENIVAIKEANGDISKIVETMRRVNGKLDLYSGNDDQIVPLMSMGGIGAISVLSNLLPRKTKEICTNFFNGNIKESARLQCELHPLIDALFSEVNPIPVKAAMHYMGFGENYLRLPLTQMDEGKCKVMLNLMREQGLKV
ncbi:MAG: 4-hydroxy-tetrahydrodipicolinate synthase [Clostridia bacterium]|nr:4-hydroxy-tetrahydrodipicolinate synthase [Clostridia bacterium]